MDRTPHLLSLIVPLSSSTRPSPDVQYRPDSASGVSVLLNRHSIYKFSISTRLRDLALTCPKFQSPLSPQHDKAASEWLSRQILGRLCHDLPLSSMSSHRRDDYILQHHQQQGSSKSCWVFMTYRLSSDITCTKPASKQTHSELSPKSCRVPLAHSESASMYSCSDILEPKSAERKYDGKHWASRRIWKFHFVLRLEESLTERFPHSFPLTLRGAQLSK